ncbi:MAG: ADP-glyceromanno-heptose 6-epimerase [Lentisphaerae bacterium]|nr:ADP-glyceromanno-heptose 6-epimerase [Lentisphaerota bacterium]
MGKFIVTGGAGLIGSNIVKHLNLRGEEDVLVVDHLNHPDKQRNLDRLKFSGYMDREEFREAIRKKRVSPASGVFHLGACSSTLETNENFLDDNNTYYTRDLCLWSLENGARFIYASSAATYGDGSLGYSDADQITPNLQPLNLYGWSKQKFDVWALREGLFDKITGLKYFNVFGPGEDHKGEMRSVVNKSFKGIIDTGKISLFKSYKENYADGEQERDFIYVDDAAKVTLWFYDNPDKSGLFNCGTGKARTWLDLAHAMFAALEIEPDIDFIPMPEELQGRYQYHTEADISKLRQSGCDLQFGSLEETVDDYIKNYLLKMG